MNENIGAALMQQQQQAAPVETNPILAILAKTKNDPEFAKALQVAGLQLLNSGKNESTIRSFARAASAGLSTYDLAKERTAKGKEEAEEKSYKRGMDERRTKAEEKRFAVANEADRRQFIRGEANAKADQANRDRAHELDKQRLGIERGRASKETKPTESEQELKMAMQQITNAYMQEGAAPPVGPALYFEAQQYIQALKQKAQPPTGGINAAAALTSATNAATGRETPEELAAVAQRYQQLLPPTAPAQVDPLDAVKQKARAARPPINPQFGPLAGTEPSSPFGPPGGGPPVEEAPPQMAPQAPVINRSPELATIKLRPEGNVTYIVTGVTPTGEYEVTAYRAGTPVASKLVSDMDLRSRLQ